MEDEMQAGGQGYQRKQDMIEINNHNSCRLKNSEVWETHRKEYWGGDIVLLLYYCMEESIRAFNTGSCASRCMGINSG